MSAGRTGISAWIRRSCRAGAVAVAAAGIVVVVWRAQGSRSGAPREGITVHGQWAIDVRQPDGTLVTHREFENALLPGGSNLLAYVLGHSATPGHWAVILFQNPFPATFCADPQNFTIATTCLVAPNYVLQEPNISVTGVNGAVTLMGTTTATAAGALGAVGTAMNWCGAGVLNSDCQLLNGPLRLFTGAQLGPGGAASTIPVTAGQIIQVTVTLTFS